ncbi:hypothetical protein B0H10DRAFT_1939185 [Mycena sp. CBHHK59/15]|nr:hypothetical protein B0H10DRAFT_1939185 [Mycena sp. CBHHK59/15]
MVITAFARFGTFFRTTFSVLWSKLRRFFRSRRAALDDVEAGLKASETGVPILDSTPTYALDLLGVPALTLVSIPIASATYDRSTSVSPCQDVSFTPPLKAAHSTSSPTAPTTVYTAVVPEVDVEQTPPNTVSHTSAPKIKEDQAPGPKNPAAREPLGSITNTPRASIGNVLFPTRPRAQTLRRVRAHPDLRSPSRDAPPAHAKPLLAPAPSPGSTAWQTEKATLLGEARAWSTRVKTSRRHSLPTSPSSAPPLFPDRRASAPANLGSTRLSVEERLRRAVSSPPPKVPAPAPDETPQFVIGDDGDHDGDATFVCSELPYLQSVSPSPSSGTLEWSGSAGTLTEVIDALEAMLKTPKWLSLVDLQGAAVRVEARLRGLGRD